MTEDNDSTDLISLKSFNPNNCQRCGKEIKKKLLLFNSKKECFICNKTTCNDCTSKEERIESSTGRKGYVCLDCYPKTRIAYSSSLFPGVSDLNGIVESIESRIPNQLEIIVKSIDNVQTVTTTLNKIIDTINRQVGEVKEFSQSFTLKNWSIIKKDIYSILFFVAIGIIVLVFILTFMIMLMLKYIYPVL